MSIYTKLLQVSAILIGSVGLAQPLPGQVLLPALAKRPVTVEDTIRMTRVAGPLDASAYQGAGPTSGFSVFSPNGKRFVIVISKGDLAKNTDDYSLLLFHTADIFRASAPTILATFSSSSNRAGISEASWSQDNRTVFFLGARGEGPTQLYSIRCSSGQLRRLSNQHTSLVSYAMSASPGTFAFAAETPDSDLRNDQVLHSGFDVTQEGLADLLRGRISHDTPRLFFRRNASAGEKSLQTLDPFDSGVNSLFLSPNGRYLVVKTDATELPDSWRQYDDVSIQTVFRRKMPKGLPTRILHYELIDTRTGRSERLLDSPTTYSSSDVLWSSDSRSLLLCGTYLPLSAGNPDELRVRKSTRFVVEVRLPSQRIIKITSQDLSPILWDSRTNLVEFRAQSNSGSAGGTPEPVYYRKEQGVWKRLKSGPSAASVTRPEILVEQGLNEPPRIVAVDPETNRKTTLFDLNPQFAGLAFGKVEELRWTDDSGDSVEGGLYLPPDYKTGTKYPLVIQTHGFDPHEFWIDGPHTTAFAAQPLVSRGIVVLQINDIFYNSLETPQEPMRAMRAYESAISYLSRKGIIDPSRVGLIGFSRTCLYVKYALTHSVQHFAAAIVSDGIDAGYLQYVINYNSNPILSVDAEAVIGAAPFGAGLSLWLKRSPGFLLQHVHAPLLIQALNPSSLLGEWEWFSGLKSLNKPVDLTYLPDGAHVLVKPWDRIVSQEETVEWFCFWLKNGEDLDPRKTEQYARWRELRAQLHADSLKK
ncbi:MAG TPA: hypothetical protein VNE63_09640 [Candidatus Acidoferrales bacterium]|nr:hypothetical protein [Candidatus Acidoferrales bacterium]